MKVLIDEPVGPIIPASALDYAKHYLIIGDCLGYVVSDDREKYRVFWVDDGIVSRPYKTVQDLVIAYDLEGYDIHAYAVDNGEDVTISININEEEED